MESMWNLWGSVKYRRPVTILLAMEWIVEMQDDVG